MARTVLPYLLALHTAPRPYLLLSLPAAALPSTSGAEPSASAAEHDSLPAQVLHFLRSAGIQEQLQVFAPAACGAASPLVAELSGANLLQSVRFLTCLAQRKPTSGEGESSPPADSSPDALLTREGATVVDLVANPAPSTLEYRLGDPLAPINESCHDSSIYSPFTKSLDGVVQRLEASVSPTLILASPEICCALRCYFLGLPIEHNLTPSSSFAAAAFHDTTSQPRHLVQLTFESSCAACPVERVVTLDMRSHHGGDALEDRATAKIAAAADFAPPVS